jgi:hypothetical protein
MLTLNRVHVNKYESLYQDGAAVLEKWQRIRANPRELAQKGPGIAWPARPADTSTDMSGKQTQGAKSDNSAINSTREQLGKL